MQTEMVGEKSVEDGKTRRRLRHRLSQRLTEQGIELRSTSGLRKLNCATLTRLLEIEDPKTFLAATKTALIERIQHRVARNPRGLGIPAHCLGGSIPWLCRLLGMNNHELADRAEHLIDTGYSI